MRLLLEEPYRFFFPAGLLASITGVAVWPLFYWNQLGFYPGLHHSRLMVFGFVGAYVAGFLGTALVVALVVRAARQEKGHLLTIMASHRRRLTRHLPLRAFVRERPGCTKEQRKSPEESVDHLNSVSPGRPISRQLRRTRRHGARARDASLARLDFAIATGIFHP